MLLRLEAINLKAIPYSESSQIVVVFTREMGRMSFMAKGVRKSKRSDKGKLQSFMHNRYIISKKSGMGIVCAIDNLNPFYELGQNLDKLKAAYLCLNLVYRVIQDHHPNEPLFDLLLHTLTELETSPEMDFSIILSEFKIHLIRIEGLLCPEETSIHEIDQTLQNYLSEYSVMEGFT